MAANAAHADGKIFGEVDAEEGDIDPDDERIDDTEERSPAESEPAPGSVTDTPTTSRCSKCPSFCMALRLVYGRGPSDRMFSTEDRGNHGKQKKIKKQKSAKFLQSMRIFPERRSVALLPNVRFPAAHLEPSHAHSEVLSCVSPLPLGDVEIMKLSWAPSEACGRQAVAKRRRHGQKPTNISSSMLTKIMR